MELINTMRLLNIITAVATLPASFYLLKVALSERKVINSMEQKLNSILIVLFVGVGFGSILNAIISIIVIMGAGPLGHGIAQYRTVLLNVFFTFVAWSLLLFHKKISEK